jgi:hypothetical protein
MTLRIELCRSIWLHSGFPSLFLLTCDHMIHKSMMHGLANTNGLIFFSRTRMRAAYHYIKKKNRSNID